ncbi:MAG TPA: site-2 protease family protein [Gemmataceae bacterium]|nr:site-2 protease family protein [Gemmataceae bacterium]
MGWSFRVGRLAGINIFVHFTFLLLLGWVALSGYAATGDPMVALSGVLLICAIFFIIVLHELGHALAARYYGIPTKDITLLPIGGVARLERMPEKPAQELVVALAGPAVNVVLAVFFGALLLLQGPLQPKPMAVSLDGGLVTQLFKINVWLVLFNMLPAFPMDGGRVLRAVLAMRLGANRATQIAARVGQGMAILFAVVGLLGIPGVVEPNLMLALLALFVWIGAREEAAAVRTRSGLAGVSVGALMVRQFAAVSPDDPLETVGRYARRTFQQDFPVTVSGRVIGLLGRDDLRRGLHEYGPNSRVMQVMRRDFPTVSPDEPAERGLALLSAGAPVVPVLYYGRLVGLLTPENMAEFLWQQQEAGDRRLVDSGWDRTATRV